MGFFIFVKMRLFPILLLVSLTVMQGCTQGSSPRTSTPDLAALIGGVQFPDFENFPDYQFKTLALGETNEAIISIVSDLQVEQKGNAEVVHFFFPKDSTELILPDQPILSEFKVYLFSDNYLQNEADFRTYFEEKATFVMKDATFQIFQFNTATTHFKMTYFCQKDFIRLHFIHTPDHS